MSKFMENSNCGKGAVIRGFTDESGKERPAIVVSDTTLPEMGGYGSRIDIAVLQSLAKSDYSIPCKTLGRTGFVDVVCGIKHLFSRDMSIKTKLVAVAPPKIIELIISTQQAWIASDVNRLDEIRREIHDIRVRFMNENNIDYIVYSYTQGCGSVKSWEKRVFSDGHTEIVPRDVSRKTSIVYNTNKDQSRPRECGWFVTERIDDNIDHTPNRSTKLSHAEWARGKILKNQPTANILNFAWMAETYPLYQTAAAYGISPSTASTRLKNIKNELKRRGISNMHEFNNVIISGTADSPK